MGWEGMEKRSWIRQNGRKWRKCTIPFVLLHNDKAFNYGITYYFFPQNICLIQCTKWPALWMNQGCGVREGIVYRILASAPEKLVLSSE